MNMNEAYTNHFDLFGKNSIINKLFSIENSIFIQS